jgi:hypothetical protein
MKLKNQSTGQEIEVDDSKEGKSFYRFRSGCRGIDEIAEAENLVIYFLTLTLEDGEVGAGNEVLHKLFCFMRARFKKAGKKFYQTWVVEFQKHRYKKYGVYANHWHIAIAVEDGTLPWCVEIKENGKRKRFEIMMDGSIIKNNELHKRWGKGIIFCERVQTSVYGYLSKYLEKEKPDGVVRRFGSSQLGYHKYPQWAFDFVKERMKEYPDLEDFKIRKIKGEVGFYLVEENKKLRKVSVMRSPWRFVRK